MLLAPLTTSRAIATGEGRGTMGVVPGSNVVNVVVGLFVGRLVQVIGSSEPTG
jgi:hypothetical protein